MAIGQADDTDLVHLRSLTAGGGRVSPNGHASVLCVASRPQAAKKIHPPQGPIGMPPGRPPARGRRRGRSGYRPSEAARGV
jgi:hypothetical protein